MCGNEEFYIGSTTKSLRDRLRAHKVKSRKSNSKVSKWIRKFGEEFLVIIPLFVVSGLCTKDLRALERYTIERYGATLNMNQPIITREEHLKDMIRLNSKELSCLCSKVVTQSVLCSHTRSKKHQLELYRYYY